MSIPTEVSLADLARFLGIFKPAYPNTGARASSRLSQTRRSTSPPPCLVCLIREHGLAGCTEGERKKDSETAARELVAWAQPQGIKVEFGVRREGRLDVIHVFLAAG
jgi:hypothetical protein